MSDLVELFLVFALIYTLECAEIVPRRAVGFVSFAGSWRVRRTFAPNAAWARGLLFADPWPPLAPALVTEDLPLTLGPDGLGLTNRAGGVDGHQSGNDDPEDRFIPWTAVESVAAAGSLLRINGETAARLATRRSARELASVCEELKRLPPAAREPRLRSWLDTRFDGSATAARVAAFRSETRALRIAANLLWAGLFLALPAVLFTALVELLLPVAAFTLVSWAAAAVLFERTLRRSRFLDRDLRPELSKRIVAVTSPLATLRSTDHLARELCGDLDPMAVASAFLPPARLNAFARPRLADLRYRQPRVAAGGEADWLWWRGEVRRRCEESLRAQNLDPDAMLAPPERPDPDVVAWCPRCLTQYRASTPPRTACENPECRGISLGVIGPASRT